ncbi:MAG: cytochrome c oxidase assembly protein [Alphaproteobacteria bacterium]|nr:cytochrome c oxidase assembly protein [Alphaproteobacteria bacterium]
MAIHPHRNTVILICALLAAMTALAYASVPLYRLFCQQTGYGGTTQVAIAPTGDIRERYIRVQFNADVNPALPWRFKPLQHEIIVRAGESALAFYEAENLSDLPLKGMAIYNVTPDKAGIYFNKIECFCFIEQTLEPHKVVEMPVQFFISPEFADDKNVEDISTITLSYTFFPFKS